MWGAAICMPPAQTSCKIQLKKEKWSGVMRLHHFPMVGDTGERGAVNQSLRKKKQALESPADRTTKVHNEHQAQRRRRPVQRLGSHNGKDG